MLQSKLNCLHFYIYSLKHIHHSYHLFSSNIKKVLVFTIIFIDL